MGSLKLVNISATGLVNRDTFGKSDPLCEVTIAGVKQATEALSNNHEPTWKGQQKWKPWRIADPWEQSLFVEFTVWDDDPVGKDFLGYCKVPLTAKRGTQGILPEERGKGYAAASLPWTEKGVTLVGRPGNKGDAELQAKSPFGTLRFSFVYEGDAKSGTTATAQAPAAAATGSGPSASRAASPPPSGMAPHLKFTALYAESLIKQDMRSSDPFLVMTLPGYSGGEKEYRTETLSNTLNPTWEKPKEWTIDLSTGVLPMLEFTVWDEDTLYNDPLGYAAKQLAPSDLQHGCETRLQLALTVRPGMEEKDASLFEKQSDKALRAQKSLGILKLSMVFYGDPKKLAVARDKVALTLKPLYDAYQASLRVRVLRGANLAAVGGGTSLEPYVEIKMKDERGMPVGNKITARKVDDSTKNQLNPVWDHEYVCIEDARQVASVVFVLKHNRMLGDVHCGRAELPFAAGRPSKEGKCVLSMGPRLGQSESEDRDLLKKLKRNNFGELIVAYDYQVVRAGEMTEMCRMGSGARDLPAQKHLHLYVDKVEKMLWKDEKVLVKMRVGDGVFETPDTVKMQGVNAGIRHTFEIGVSKDFVQVELWFYATGFTGKECIGVATTLLDVRKAAAPVSLVEELHPHDQASCLERLNEHVAAGSASSLGKVFLSYQLADADRKVDESSLAKQAQKPPPAKPAAGDGDRDAFNDGYNTSDQPPYDAFAQTGARKAASGWHLCLQLDRAEGLPARSPQDAVDAYAILSRGVDDESEHKTCAVPNSSEPRWHYACDVHGASKDEALCLSVFDRDPAGYDQFLGEASLRVDELLKGDYTSVRCGAVDLVLRRNADGSLSDAPASWMARKAQQQQQRPGRVFFRWRLVEEAEERAMWAKAAKPSVLEVLVQGASGLPADAEAPKYAVLTLNAGDERRTSSDAGAEWRQEFQFAVGRVMNTLKLSLWEGQSYARFLGEATLEVCTTCPSNGPQVVELLPRRDPHYTKDDVKLLNSRPTGLGSVTLSWCLREGKARRKFPMDPYTVVVHVLEVADLAKPKKGLPQHYVTAEIKGCEAQGPVRYSQVERGVRPRFRAQFEFQLQHDYEEVKVKLYERDAAKKDTQVASLTFPVGPSQCEAAVSEQTWAELKPVKGVTSAPRLLYMWKAVLDPGARQRMLQQRQQQSRSPGGTMTSDTSLRDPYNSSAYNTTGSSVAGGMNTTVGSNVGYPQLQQKQQLNNPYQQPRPFSCDKLQSPYAAPVEQPVYLEQPPSPYVQPQHAPVSVTAQGSVYDPYYPQQHQQPPPAQPQYPYPVPPPRSDSGDTQGFYDNTLHKTDAERALQRQVAALAAQNQELAEQVRRLTERLSTPGSLAASVPRQPRCISVLVEHGETRRRSTLQVSVPTDAGTVIEQAKRELELSLLGEYVLRFMGHELNPDDPLHGLAEGDTLLICRGERFRSRRSPRYGRVGTPDDAGSALASPPRTRSPQRRPLSATAVHGAVNEAVLARLRIAAAHRQEHLTVALWAAARDDAALVGHCSQSGFPGFARPHPAKLNHTEVVLQGSAEALVPVVLRAMSLTEGQGVEVELVEVCVCVNRSRTSHYCTGERLHPASHDNLPLHA